MNNEKVKVAKLSVFSNTFLVIIKLMAGIMSGSVSIISEAVHSAMDLIASVIAYFSVKISSKPADKEHPYGHGKVENISGVIEGVLILIAVIWIVYEAIEKILHPSELKLAPVAITVMLISAIVNIFVSKKLYKVARETDSIALEADALHLKTDVYTSLGVAIGLLLIQFTKIHILDPIVAMLVALLILKESIHLIKNAFMPLIDEKLSDEELAIIEEVIKKSDNEILGYHKLRTRKAGCTKHIDFHMTVDGEMTVKRSHDICERIEDELENRLKNTSVNIHIEPQKTYINEMEKIDE